MKVSLLLITNNDSKYIRQCMEGILLQQFSWLTEIVVADNNSTDHTLLIIQEYNNKIPCTFNFLTNEENISTTRNYQRGFAACKGDYVAVIQGSDYWVDPLRLKKHIDFLDHHYECVMTMDRMVCYQEAKSLYDVSPWIEKDNYKYITSQQIASGDKSGNFSASVFRKKELDKIKPDFFQLPVSDWLIRMVLGQYGLIVQFKDVMSIYRIHENNKDE
ncbi:MAG: glycosyltransferase, partial [Sphingobacteriales bacterium]|nr:glycosyltransferase [Sphingobacteriales bacterium]